jgi:O-antigen/teichoic acid export membrane protein
LSDVAPDLIDTAQAGPAAMRGGLLRTGGYVAGLLLALVSAPLLVRYLGDETFGRYSTVLAVVAIVAGLVEGGVSTIALRELSTTRVPAERDRLMRELLGMRLTFCLIGVILAVGFSAVAGYGPSLVLGTLLAGVGMVIQLTQMLVVTALQSRLRFGWGAVIEVARQFVSTALIVALVLAGGGVVAFLATGIFAGAAALGLTMWLVRGDISLRPTLHPRHWAPLLRDTAVFAVAIAVNTLYFRLSLIVLGLVSTDAAVGEFSISYRVMEVLIGVPGLLIGAAFPIVSRAARDDRARFEYATGRIFELGVLMGALFALTVCLGAPFAIQVLTGQRDHPSVGILELQSVALLAAFVAAATGYPLLSLKRNRETLIANCVALVAVLALSFALSPSLGAKGAAAAAVTADYALAIVNALMLVRRGGPRLPLSILPVALIAGAAGFGAGRLVGIHPVIEAAVGALVFLAIVGLARRFPPEVRELLKRR